MKTKERTVNVSRDILLPLGKKCAEYLQPVLNYLPKVTVTKTVSAAAFLRIEINPQSVQNGYRITKKEETAVVTGSDLSQTVRGAYAYLQSAAGIRMYTSKLLKYTRASKELCLPREVTYHPYFEYTETDWLSARNAEYSLFNGLNGAVYRKIPSEFGETVNYLKGFGHTLTTKFCGAEKYFSSHPEYFALRHAKRKPTQLCLTNPDVLKIVTEEVLELLKTEHDPNAPLQIVSVTQHDNIGFCTCSACKKTDKRYGSHAGSLLLFVNSIAKKVKEAGYHNVAIDTFAYRYTRTPPVGLKPEDNVIIRLCSIECCFSHPLDDKSCPTNRAFMKDLKGWSDICSRIYIWDYCTNFSNFAGIFPNFGVLRRNIQIFAENHVKGVYEEGNFTMTAESEFGELRCYLISKLLEDPYCDHNALLYEFTDAFYGEGAKAVREFLSLITTQASFGHLGIYQPMFGTLNLNKNQITYCDALWEKAKSTALGEARQNVLASELSWRWWKMGNRVKEFADPLNFACEKEKLVRDLNSFGVTRFTEADAKTAFRISLGQEMYFKAYPLVKFGLDRVYGV